MTSEHLDWYQRTADIEGEAYRKIALEALEEARDGKQIDPQKHRRILLEKLAELSIESSKDNS